MLVRKLLDRHLQRRQGRRRHGKQTLNERVLLDGGCRAAAPTVVAGGCASVMSMLPAGQTPTALAHAALRCSMAKKQAHLQLRHVTVPIRDWRGQRECHTGGLACNRVCVPVGQSLHNMAVVATRMAATGGRVVEEGG